MAQRSGMSWRILAGNVTWTAARNVTGTAARIMAAARAVVMAAVMAAVMALCLLPLSSTPAHAQSVVLDDGHVDAFNVSAYAGELELALKEDITGQHVLHAPEDVVLHVGEHAYSDEPAQVPEIGQPGYFLPQAQQQGLIWPGWDTQDVRAEGFGEVQLHFAEVTGPGEVFLFKTTGFGDVESFLDDGGLELVSGSMLVQANPAHVHANWLFTQPGTYHMQVYASADGIRSATATYTWTVGSSTPTDADAQLPEPPLPAPPLQDRPLPAPPLSDRPLPDRPPASSPPAQQPNSPAQPPARLSRQEVGGKGASPSKNAPAPVCRPGLVPTVKDDRTVPAQWRNPAELTFGLTAAARVDLPQAIGPVPAGPAWMIGATQTAGVPWLGANTQHPSLAGSTTGQVRWDVVSMDGPGAMVVFTQGGLGKVVGEEWFRAAGGAVQGSHTIAPNTHVHPAWVFSAPGTYKVTIRQSAQTTSGDTVSGTGTLTFIVGGAGNANDGHFDLGTQFVAQAQCGQEQPEVVAASGQVPDAGAAAASTGDTGAADLLGALGDVQPGQPLPTADAPLTGSLGDAAGQKAATPGGIDQLAATSMQTMALPCAALALGLTVLAIGYVRWRSSQQLRARRGLR